MHITLDANTLLRALSANDVEALFNAVDDNRAHLRPWLPWVDATIAVEDTQAFVDRTLSRQQAGTGLAAIVEFRRSVCGVVGLDHIDLANRCSDIGYWLVESAQGLGIMTRAVNAMVAHAFTILRLNRLSIQAAVQNLRSRRVAERLGFREEGVLRQAERHGDTYFDLVCYSLLKSEFETQ